MRWLILIEATLLITGCAPKFTDEQAKSIVKKCVERRYCEGKIVSLDELDIVKRKDAVNGLKRLPVAWDLHGRVQFTGETHWGSNVHEYCRKEFTSRVTFQKVSEDYQAAHSDDPIALVQIDPKPIDLGRQGERKRCYYFLASARSAEH